MGADQIFVEQKILENKKQKTVFQFLVEYEYSNRIDSVIRKKKELNLLVND